MIKQIQISIPFEFIQDNDKILGYIAQHLSVSKKEISDFSIRKRSIDARAKQVKFQLAIDVFIDEKILEEVFQPNLKNISNEREVYIVGAGPAGYFAALRCIENGLKPIVIERGKAVRERRRDLANITKNHIVNPDSNYCFGEGGAGTYSDGKLYTRSDKRGDVKTILDWFIYFGADEDIRVNSRPHIGTNKLPEIITKMREAIESCGGEVRFNVRLEDIEIVNQKVSKLIFSDGTAVSSNALILATGHSSRQIFELLERRKIFYEAKPIAIGLRAEHPQHIIDQSQYHCTIRPELLPPAYYSLVSQEIGRGVYSFCMCPGGIIAPCATAPGEIVTNGWSPSKRNNEYANSGIVVELRLEDIASFGYFNSANMVLDFQKKIEQLACNLAGNTQTAPAQRLVDFISKKHSNTLPNSSYTPGIKSVDMDEVFPEFIAERLRNGFKEFAKKIKGYDTENAVLVAPETRTSSPIKLPRDKETLMHTKIIGLFPCGEGAGYAGGIVSAAIDGMNCADAVMQFFQSSKY